MNGKRSLLVLGNLRDKVLGCQEKKRLKFERGNVEQRYGIFYVCSLAKLRIPGPYRPGMGKPTRLCVRPHADERSLMLQILDIEYWMKNPKRKVLF